MTWIRRSKASLTALLALSGLGGCVGASRYTIRTDPPGALVVVNAEEKGTSPVSSSYVFYGKRSVRIVKDGFEPLDIVQDFPAPWYDNLPHRVLLRHREPDPLHLPRRADAPPYQLQARGHDRAQTKLLSGMPRSLRAEAQTKIPRARPGQSILGYFGFD